MAECKISIIMPTYRREHTIESTIETILAQTYRNWELIIVDNAGDAGYRFSDSRIRVFEDARQIGACYARNQAIPRATGDLICFFDDDDEMFPNYLQTFVGVFEANAKVKMVRAGMVLSNGSIDYSRATPSVCLRREFATPTWIGDRYDADQEYFRAIETDNRWTEMMGDIILLKTIICRANLNPRGGIREGRY